MISIDDRIVRVVDAHVHIFPDELSRAREDWLERDHWFRHLYERPDARLATAEDLIASMDEAGVDVSIVCGFPWSDLEHCRFHNAYMRASVARFPDRLAWLAITLPGDDGARLAEACFADGAAGIGELNADAQGFRWTDTEHLRSLAECARNHGKPIMLHASEPVGHVYPGKGAATPGEVAGFAESFPGLSIVAAHWGGGLPFYELMPKARPSLEHVVYDSAATTYLYDQRIFEQVIGMAGTEKVLFASDYPVLGQARLLRRMTSVAWPSRDAAELVLHGNAERVYGLGTGS